MSRTARLVPALTITIIAAAVIVASANPASAHSALEGSTPVGGTTLDAPPTQIVLEFSEPPDLAISEFDLLDASGADVAIGQPTASPNGRTITIPTPDLTEGAFTLGYRVTSTIDGHTTGGVVAFGVGTEPTSSPDRSAYRTPGPSASSVAGRWLLYVGLGLLLAGGPAWSLVFRARPARFVPLTIGAWIATAIGATIVTAAAARAADATLATFVASSTGGAFVRQAIAVLVCGGTVVVAIRRPTERAAAIVGAAAAVVVAFHVAGGHAGAERDATWFAIGVQWLHAVAAGVWIGGLAWLLLGAQRPGDPDQAPVVRRMSTIAGVMLGVVVATGLARSISLLGGFGALTDLLGSDWGTALATKVGVVVLLVALGAWNRFRRIPALDRGSSPGIVRTVVAELVLAAGVFALTGVLAGLPPPDATADEPPRAQGVLVTSEDFATTVRVRLTINPGRPGPNRIQATVHDFDSGAPVPAESVTMRIGPEARPDLPPIEIDLKAVGDTWSTSSSAIAIAGPWDGTLTVQTASGSVRVPLAFTIARAPQRTTVTPGTGGLPTLTTIELGDGRSVQAYLDPEVPGPSQVHVTAFDTAGQELPLSRASMTAVGPGTPSEVLDATRLSPGHFVAPVDLTSGTWRFEIDADARSGAPIVVTFEQEV